MADQRQDALENREDVPYTDKEAASKRRRFDLCRRAVMIENYLDISVERLRDYMERHHSDEYLLVDVREMDEYIKGHIPGSVLIPLGQLPERMSELPVDKDVIFYCRSGKRSRGAALFTGSRPYVAGTVFHMVGGLLAWDGLLQPEMPNLKVFDFSGTDQDVLLRAMNLERGAAQFYTAILQRYGSIPWADSLSTLAGAEEAHARMIYEFWAENQVAPPAFAAVYSALEGDIVEGGYSCAALLTMLEAQPFEPCRAALEMALAIEYSAYDLSRNMAHRFQGQALEQVFNAIAEAEREHMLLAARGLTHCAT
jgi:rhodanese-related sulfurtransferase/rubrerythrin